MGSETGARWGEAPAPLVPRCLREGECGSWAVSGAVTRALGLPKGVRYRDLDGRSWNVLDAPVANHALALLVTDVERLPARAFTGKAFPEGAARAMRWEALPVRPRTRRAVRRSGLEDGRVDADALNLAGLLRLRGMNMMSALELACVVETVSREGEAQVQRRAPAAAEHVARESGHSGTPAAEAAPAQIAPWGRAPTPLVPAILRGEDAPPLRPEVSRALGLGTPATCAELGTHYWVGRDQSTDPRTLRELAQSLNVEMRKRAGRPVAAGSLPRAVRPGDLPLRTRTRNGLERAGILAAPQRLASLTVWDFLTLPGFGVLSVLDLMCVVEAAVQPVGGSGGRIPPAFGGGLAAWGRPGAPLLPEPIRRALAGERVPGWLAEELGHGDGLTYDQLDASAWRREGSVHDSDRRSELGRIAQRTWGVVAGQPAVPGGLPEGTRWKDLPLQTRTRNQIEKAARSAGLGVEDFLGQRHTFGDFVSIPSFGMISVLDLSCVLECARSVTMGADELPPLTDSDRALFAAVAGQPWAAHLHVADPRVAPYLPPGPGTVRERIHAILADPAGKGSPGAACLAGLMKLEPFVARLERLPLEPALREFLRACVDWPEDREEAVLARLGWSGDPPCTLQEAGNMLGVTRERLRQYESRLAAKFPGDTVHLPALKRALEALSGRAPLAADAVGPLLKELGLAEGHFSAESLLRTAETLRHPHDFQIVAFGGTRIVVRAGQQEELRELRFRVDRYLSAQGFVALASVQEEARSLVRPIEERLPQALRALFPDHTVHGGWLFDFDWGSTWLKRRLHKMLAVHAPQPVESLLAGIERSAKYRASTRGKPMPELPDAESFRAGLAAHPEFAVSDDGRVAARQRLDPHELLSRSEKALYAVFAEEGFRSMSRAEASAQLRARGVGGHAITQHFCYSPLLERVAENVWALRGTAPAAPGEARAAGRAGGVPRLGVRTATQ